MLSRSLLSLLAAASLCLVSVCARAQLPPGFVYLSKVAPDILQDIRYATPHNFVGRPISGYRAGECILTAKAAKALALVQAELAKRKQSLVVWDCYRPATAVADFINWSRVPQDHKAKEEFYPNSDKTQLFSLGYLATRSAHSRGSTVDLGIVPAGTTAPDHQAVGRLIPCTAPKGQRFEDGTINFGTGYDCLDVLASTRAPGLPEEAYQNRQLLSDLMTRYGFRPYSREWWHFELINEPFPHQVFDFPITRPSEASVAERINPPTGVAASDNQTSGELLAQLSELIEKRGEDWHKGLDEKICGILKLSTLECSSVQCRGLDSETAVRLENGLNEFLEVSICSVAQSNKRFFVWSSSNKDASGGYVTDPSGNPLAEYIEGHAGEIELKTATYSDLERDMKHWTAEYPKISNKFKAETAGIERLSVAADKVGDEAFCYARLSPESGLYCDNCRELKDGERKFIHCPNGTVFLQDQRKTTSHAYSSTTQTES
jgi:D-alanyl-D-alanine dipeptidase